MKRVKHESLKTAETLGHHLTPFTPYGDRQYAYCLNSSGGEGWSGQLNASPGLRAS